MENMGLVGQDVIDVLCVCDELDKHDGIAQVVRRLV